MIIRKLALEIAAAGSGGPNSNHPAHSAVYVIPAEHTVYGTNGFSLLTVVDKYPESDSEFPLIPAAPYTADPPPFSLPVSVMAGLLKAMPKKDTIRILHSVQASIAADPTAITVAATDLSAPRVATLYPENETRVLDLGKVHPRAEEVFAKGSVTVSLSPAVLEGLVKAAKLALGRNPVITLQIPTCEPVVKDALGVKIGSEAFTITGLAMPVVGT